MASSDNLVYLTNITTIIKYCKVYEKKNYPSQERTDEGEVWVSLLIDYPEVSAQAAI